VPPDAARAAAEAVAKAVMREARVLRAPRIALYATTRSELPTRPLFDALGGARMPRLLPRVRAGMLEWGVAEVWEELVPGRFGILEPVGDAVRAPGPDEVVLLPCLAFDAQGWRLGRGGGHYDRAFPSDRGAPWLVGVGYAFQRVAAVPHDSRDRRVDAIVTEQGFVWQTEAG
jgi:5-formyltetrahydrofolate cyclo-ligase